MKRKIGFIDGANGLTGNAIRAVHFRSKSLLKPWLQISQGGFWKKKCCCGSILEMIFKPQEKCIEIEKYVPLLFDK